MCVHHTIWGTYMSDRKEVVCVSFVVGNQRLVVYVYPLYVFRAYRSSARSVGFAPSRSGTVGFCCVLSCFAMIVVECQETPAVRALTCSICRLDNGKLRVMLRSHLHPHVFALTFVCIDAHCILSTSATPRLCAYVRCQGFRQFSLACARACVMCCVYAPTTCGSNYRSIRVNRRPEVD